MSAVSVAEKNAENTSNTTTSPRSMPTGALSNKERDSFKEAAG
jgi:hypothetical protein